VLCILTPFLATGCVSENAGWRKKVPPLALYEENVPRKLRIRNL